MRHFTESVWLVKKHSGKSCVPAELGTNGIFQVAADGLHRYMQQECADFLQIQVVPRFLRPVFFTGLFYFCKYKIIQNF